MFKYPRLHLDLNPILRIKTQQIVQHSDVNEFWIFYNPSLLAALAFGVWKDIAVLTSVCVEKKKQIQKKMRLEC